MIFGMCMHYGFGARLRQVAVQEGALLTLFFAWNASQTFKELEVKQSVMVHCVKVTHPLLYQ